MKRYFQLTMFCGIAVLLIVVGCSRQLKPEGLPDLVPFELTLTQGENPVQGVSVEFKSPDVPWPISGMTDANGKAKMVTYGQFSGVPIGSYKVTATQRETEIVPMPGNTKLKKMTVYSLIEPALEKQDKTPLELTVEKGKKTATFDIGDAVRIVVDSDVFSSDE
jgi:hypothetical protein